MNSQTQFNNKTSEFNPPFTLEQGISDPSTVSSSSPQTFTNPSTTIPGNPILINESVSEYLYRHLSVATLNDIHPWLSWAKEHMTEIVPPPFTTLHQRRRGEATTQEPIRPLHRHLMLHRSITITEDPCLHLTVMPSTIHIKPLPPYLLHWNFFKAEICPDKTLYEYAAGFLSTYPYLVRNRSDFTIAKDRGLLPETLEWEEWSVLATALAGMDKMYMNRRYEHGEFSLRRLNLTFLVCRSYIPYELFKGEDLFFEHYFKSWIVVFGYFAIMLTALQLAVATPGATETVKSVAYVVAIMSALLVVGSAMLFLTWVSGRYCCTLFGKVVAHVGSLGAKGG